LLRYGWQVFAPDTLPCKLVQQRTAGSASQLGKLFANRSFRILHYCSFARPHAFSDG